MVMPDTAHIEIVCTLLRDVYAQFPEVSLKELERDCEYIIQRYNSEGIQFLLNTLPSLGKHFDSSLKQAFQPTPSFKREKGRTTPRFMRHLFRKVFNDSGEILRNGCPHAVRGIRQVCFVFYKYEADYPETLVDSTIAQFTKTDISLGEHVRHSQEEQVILAHAAHIMYHIFKGFDPQDIVPYPGPGASASGTDIYERFHPTVRYDDLHQVYPYYDWMYLNRNHLLDRVSEYKRLPRAPHGVSRLALVPKDSRGPRIICMEPQEYMFLQQGLGSAMRRHLESHWLTKGRVNFSSQDTNRDLSRIGSLTGVYSTLDMKEASDRISLRLVEDLFSELPELLAALVALRSPEVQLPNGNLHRMRKFAPMGSSLCFPVESIVHYVLALAAIEVRKKITYKALARSGAVHVYGDDIIVYTAYAPDLIASFPKFHLRFNVDKSFLEGDFRESCGYDAYQGVCVTPIRIKTRILDTANGKGRHRFDPVLLTSAFALYGSFRRHGYTKTAVALRRIIESRFGTFPNVTAKSGLFGWHSPPEEVVIRQRKFCTKLQAFTSLAREIRFVKSVSFAPTWERLFRACVSKREGDTGELSRRTDRAIVRKVRVPLHRLFAV